MNISKLKILFVLFISLSIGFSQVKFSAGPVIGYTGPTGDYSGTTVDYYNGAKYGLSGGIHFGAVLKIKLPVLRIRTGFSFTSLNNTGNSETDKPNSFVEVKQSLFMISAGPEFAFSVPSSPIVPYAGLDLIFTSISGQTSFQGVSKVETGTYTMSSATRLGLGLGAGAEFHFGKKYAVDISVKYNLVNLMGKKFEDLPSDKREDSYVNLNDDRDPAYPDDKHPIGSSRSISTIQLNLGFLFDF